MNTRNKSKTFPSVAFAVEDTVAILIPKGSKPTKQEVPQSADQPKHMKMEHTTEQTLSSNSTVSTIGMPC